MPICESVAAAFKPFGLWPAVRAAVRKNKSSRFIFFLTAKAAAEDGAMKGKTYILFSET
jgi:hypothetical protein